MAAATMKQERKARQQAAIREEIKATARAQMAQEGAAGLSLRAVASAMGLSSAAIYYYYANRDALITALIVDAFRALAEALRVADPGPGERIDDRLYRVMIAYRGWALATPAEFELIFGAPVPGYHAPAEVTAPEARAALSPFGELFGLAFAQGRLRDPTAAAPLPPTVSEHIEQWVRTIEQPVPTPVLVAMLQTWGYGHGLVALELNGQLQPIIGDAAGFFDHSLRALLWTLGITPTPARDVESRPATSG